jgi:Spy/CpxP family protein refolding chaperone
MRSNKAIWIAGLFGVLIGITAVVANAQNGRLIRQRFAQGQNALTRPQTWARGLNLTQDQKDQLKAILTNHQAEIKGVAKENAQARRELAAAMANGADQPTLKAAYEKVSNAGWDRVQLRSKISAEIKPILTPEQLQQLQNRKKLIENRAQRLINRMNK